MNETTVTIKLARWLGEQGWRVLSMALPGGGSGIVFLPATGEGPGESEMLIPDLILVRDEYELLAVESKPRPNFPDAVKLSLLRSAAYGKSVKSLTGIDSSNLILAQAFGPLGDRDRIVARQVSDMVDVGFEVDPQGSINLVWDKSFLFDSGIGGKGLSY